jgi:hypothetical protein
MVLRDARKVGFEIDEANFKRQYERAFELYGALGRGRLTTCHDPSGFWVRRLFTTTQSAAASVRSRRTGNGQARLTTLVCMRAH